MAMIAYRNCAFWQLKPDTKARFPLPEYAPEFTGRQLGP